MTAEPKVCMGKCNKEMCFSLLWDKKNKRSESPQKKNNFELVL